MDFDDFWWIWGILIDMDWYGLIWIRRPLDFRRGCHQAAGVENQCSLVMFSRIGLGFRFPFVYQYPSAMWLLLGCLPSVVSNQFVSAAEPQNHTPPLPDGGFGIPLKFIKSHCKMCPWNAHQKLPLKLRLDPKFFNKSEKNVSKPTLEKVNQYVLTQLLKTMKSNFLCWPNSSFQLPSFAATWLEK